MAHSVPCPPQAAAFSLLPAPPASAAYGESANIFGGAAKTGGRVFASKSAGYSILVPPTFGPSPEREFPGVDSRFEDSGAAVNTLQVLVTPVPGKSKIEELGPPDALLPVLSPLLGVQSYDKETGSEGGFAPNKISVGHLLSSSAAAGSDGRTHYKCETLSLGSAPPPPPPRAAAPAPV